MLSTLHSDLKLHTIPGILRALGDSETRLFKHIQGYSGIFNNYNSYNSINFLFFALILYTFQRNLKRHMFFDYNDVNFNSRLILFK